MGAVRTLNLGIKVNGKEVENTFKSVTKQMYDLRREVNRTEEGTDDWVKANRELALVESKRKGMIERQKEFREEITNTTTATEGNKEAIQDFGQSFGQVTSGIINGDLIQVQEGLKGMRAGIVAATKASIAFIATPLGAVLAGLALAIGAVTQYFRDSEEGQNAWNKVTAVTGVIVGNFTDLLSDLGAMLVKVFSDPKQSLTDFSNLIRDNIINRFNGLLELIPGLGKSLQLLFSGKFSEAAKTATDAVAKVALGVENVTDKAANGFNKATDSAKRFGKEMVAETKRSMELSDLAAKADKIERDLIVERGRVEAKVAEARLKARDEERYSAAERKEFLQEAVDLQNGLLDKEIEAASIRASIKTQQNEFSKSTKEDLDEEAQLIAKVDQLRRKKAEAERTMVRDQLRVNNELQAGQKKVTAEQQKAEQEFTAFVAAQRRSREFSKLSEVDRELALIDEKYAKELEKVSGHEDKVRELELLKQQEKDEVLEKRKKESLKRLDDIEEENRLLKEEAEFERELAAAVNQAEQEELKLERARYLAEEELKILEEQKLEELRINNATEKEIAAIKENFRLQRDKLNTEFDKQEKKLAEDQVKWTNLTEEEKLSIKSNSLGKAADAFNQGSAGWKAAKIAETTVATYQGATNAYASLASIPVVGPALGAAAAAAAVVSGLKNVQRISQTPLQKIEKPGFARGGYTDGLGLGYRDESGEEVAGVVHIDEYVIPKFVRKDPEVPRIIEYLEDKRVKKLRGYATGGDTTPLGSADPLPPETSSSDPRTNQLLELILEGVTANKDIYFGPEAEMKRQELQKKLENIRSRAKVKKD